jgi:hypothetical protein
MQQIQNERQLSHAFLQWAQYPAVFSVAIAGKGFTTLEIRSNSMRYLKKYRATMWVVWRISNQGRKLLAIGVRSKMVLIDRVDQDRIRSRLQRTEQRGDNRSRSRLDKLFEGGFCDVRQEITKWGYVRWWRISFQIPAMKTRSISRESWENTNYSNCSAFTKFSFIKNILSVCESSQSWSEMTMASAAREVNLSDQIKQISGERWSTFKISFQIHDLCSFFNQWSDPSPNLWQHLLRDSDQGTSRQ